MKLDHPLQAWAKKARGGKGHHDFLSALTIFAAKSQPDFDKALAWCRAAADEFHRRPRQNNEIANLLAGAYALKHQSDRPPKILPNPTLRKSHRGAEGSIDALRISSDLSVRTAGQAIEKLFAPDDWICLLKAVNRPEFDFARNWAEKPDLHQYQFIVPNAFEQNTLSRERQGALKAFYVVHECDDKDWDAEAQIGPIMKLSEILPLKMVLWSAGHSLHAWYDVDHSKLDEFIELSRMLGGDPKCHASNHPVRLPLGTRPGKGIQDLIHIRKDNERKQNEP